MRYRSGEVPLHHTIQFDMESLLYIVLYCAILWLPHSQPGTAVSNLFSILFEEKSLRETGEATVNVFGIETTFRDGGLISDFTWECQTLQDWVTSMRRFFVSEHDWEPKKVALRWRELLHESELKKHCQDRRAQLPVMNGREKDGHRRYLGLPMVATTVPTKRALEQSTMANTTTVERNVRQKLDHMTFSSFANHASSTPPARSEGNGGNPGLLAMSSGPSRSRPWEGGQGSPSELSIPFSGAGNGQSKNTAQRRAASRGKTAESRPDKKGKGRAT